MGKRWTVQISHLLYLNQIEKVNEIIKETGESQVQFIRDAIDKALKEREATE